MNTHPVHAPGSIAQRNLHPVLWVAAIAVIVASLAAVGAIFGWIPGTGARNAEPLASASAPQALPGETPSTSLVATAPAATTTTTPTTTPSKTAPIERPVHKSKPHPVARDDARNDDYRPAPVAAVCTDCGTISNVRAIQHEGEGTGLGAVGGAVIGGVLGNQVGEGNGKRAARIGGAVLGGLAGHQVEKRVRSNTSWEVDVRMNDGSTRTVSYSQQPTWQAGDAVRVDDGEIRAR